MFFFTLTVSLQALYFKSPRAWEMRVCSYFTKTEKTTDRGFAHRHQYELL